MISPPFFSGAVSRPCNAAKDGHKPVKRRVPKGVKRMTYYEYVKMTEPKFAHESGVVDYCPDEYGLPKVSCCRGSCVDCYAQHEVPEDMVRDLFMEPIPDEDLMMMIGGTV